MKIMRSMMESPSADVKAGQTRLAKMLGVPVRTLQLSKHESKLTSKVMDSNDIDVSMDDIGGLDGILSKLETERKFVQAFPGASSSSALAGTKGILLYGPPGTGKTMIAQVFISVGPCTRPCKCGDVNHLCQLCVCCVDQRRMFVCRMCFQQGSGIMLICVAGNRKVE